MGKSERGNRAGSRERISRKAHVYIEVIALLKQQISL